jgi:probable F420-dependent oxidoreductase
MRPFRFGLQASSPPDGSARSWTELARRAEGLGYSTLTVADHLDDQLAPMPAITAAADATTTLRVGALVLCNEYRHPVVTAKEAATLDVLSGGRFELGLGAGWMATDFAGAGIPLDPPGVRIDRLAEAVQVLRGAWTGTPYTFVGDHYRVSALVGRPLPVQQPGPPVLIGGGGPKMLAVAGRLADIVGINVDLRHGVIDARAGPGATEEATDAKIATVRKAAGERFPEIELQVRVHLTAVTTDRQAVADALAPAFGLRPEQALASPHALAGTVDQITDDLLGRRERFGISYIGVGVEALDALAPVVARLAGT